MKILAIDIETRPALVYVWKVYDENVSPDQIVEPGGMISFAAKWIGEKKVEFRSDFHDNHEVMVRRVWELLDEADVVLHFNGKRFDVPHIQREFVELGLLPPSPFRQIDLLETVKRQFRFLSNKLKHVAPQLGLEGKIENEGFMLWRKCLANDEGAWKKMKSYNVRDVELLEEAYSVLRPWIKNHPSHGADRGADVCPNCGSSDLEARGYAILSTGKYQRYCCKDCGTWSRSTTRTEGTNVVQTPS